MTAARIRDAVLIAGRDVAVLAYAVHTARAELRREGRPANLDLERLADVLDTSPHVLARPQQDMVSAPARQPERMATSEAAQLLGKSRRHVGRIAHQLDGQFVGGRWLVSRQAVLEHLAGTTTKETA